MLPFSLLKAEPPNLGLPVLPALLPVLLKAEGLSLPEADAPNLGLPVLPALFPALLKAEDPPGLKGLPAADLEGLPATAPVGRLDLPDCPTFAGAADAERRPEEEESNLAAPRVPLC